MAKKVETKAPVKKAKKKPVGPAPGTNVMHVSDEPMGDLFHPAYKDKMDAYEEACEEVRRIKDRPARVVAAVRKMIYFFGNSFDTFQDLDLLARLAKIDRKDITPSTVRSAEHAERDAMRTEYERINADGGNSMVMEVKGDLRLDPDLNPHFWESVHPSKRAGAVASGGGARRASNFASAGRSGGGEGEDATPPGPPRQNAINAIPGKARPGVIATLIAFLRTGSPKSPHTKGAMLAHLVSAFPERAPNAMKATISSQVPGAMLKEKGIQCLTDGKGGWWLPKE